MDLHHFNAGAQSVLAYATVNGSLVGWDLRCGANAWTLRHDLRLGLITSFSVDVHQCWLCLGQDPGHAHRHARSRLNSSPHRYQHAGTCASSCPSLTTPTQPEHESDGCSCIRSTNHLSSPVSPETFSRTAVMIG